MKPIVTISLLLSVVSLLLSCSGDKKSSKTAQGTFPTNAEVLPSHTNSNILAHRVEGDVKKVIGEGFAVEKIINVFLDDDQYDELVVAARDRNTRRIHLFVLTGVSSGSYEILYNYISEIYGSEFVLEALPLNEKPDFAIALKGENLEGDTVVTAHKYSPAGNGEMILVFSDVVSGFVTFSKSGTSSIIQMSERIPGNSPALRITTYGWSNEIGQFALANTETVVEDGSLETKLRSAVSGGRETFLNALGGFWYYTESDNNENPIGKIIFIDVPNKTLITEEHSSDGGAEEKVMSEYEIENYYIAGTQRLTLTVKNAYISNIIHTYSILFQEYDTIAIALYNEEVWQGVYIRLDNTLADIYLNPGDAGGLSTPSFNLNGVFANDDLTMEFDPPGFTMIRGDETIKGKFIFFLHENEMYLQLEGRYDDGFRKKKENYLVEVSSETLLLTPVVFEIYGIAKDENATLLLESKE